MTSTKISIGLGSELADFDKASDYAFLAQAINFDDQLREYLDYLTDYFSQQSKARSLATDALYTVLKALPTDTPLHSYVKEQIIATERAAADQDLTYRSNVRDFLRRIIQEDQTDPLAREAQHMLGDIMAELGVERAGKLKGKIDDARRVAANIKCTVLLIHETSSKLARYSITNADIANLHTELTDLYSSPTYGPLVSRITNHKYPDHFKPTTRTGTLYVHGVDEDGVTKIRGCRSSSSPSKDYTFMESFLEFEQAARLRGLVLKDYKLGSLLISTPGE